VESCGIYRLNRLNGSKGIFTARPLHP
jgi:hypothetical protein